MPSALAVAVACRAVNTNPPQQSCVLYVGLEAFASVGAKDIGTAKEMCPRAVQEENVALEHY